MACQPTFKARLAADTLSAGGIVAHPTEAVWGLACDPDNPQALNRLLRLKQRPMEKGLILVAAELSQLLPYMAELSVDDLITLDASWPGPNTWVVPSSPAISPLLNGGKSTLAVRVSAHCGVRAMCSALKRPIVSTSANLSGCSAAQSMLRVRLYFGGGVDYYAGGSLGKGQNPSCIRELATGEILRQG